MEFSSGHKGATTWRKECVMYLKNENLREHLRLWPNGLNEVMLSAARMLVVYGFWQKLSVTKDYFC